MVSGKTIICLSTIDWHYAKQRHQIFMEHFVDAGNQVIFVEHLGFSPQRLRDIVNIVRRIWRAVCGGRRRSFRNIPAGLHILTPLVLPPQNRWCHFLNKFIFLPLVARKIRGLCRNEPVVWTYLSTTTAVNLITLLHPRRVIFDCVYDTLRHPEAPFDIAESEARLLRLADAVVTDARYFYEEKQRKHARVSQIMPGVDFEHFFAPGPLPEAVRIPDTIPRPRVCFFGCMGNEQKKADQQSRIDIDLLVFIARNRPDWSIVLIGPLVNMRLPQELNSLPNIHWLGYHPYRELPHYLAQCDVLMLPYLLNQCTEVIMPAKLFECLATGKPTVATPMAELTPFSEVIGLAPTYAEFLAKLESAIFSDTEDFRRKRLEFARENTWARRFTQISDLLERLD